VGKLYHSQAGKYSTVFSKMPVIFDDLFFSEFEIRFINCILVKNYNLKV